MRSLTSFLLVAAAPVWFAAQDPTVPPAFKTGVELVQIDVSVLDGKRQPVRGLTAADFSVLEDGQPRPIRVFETVDLPARSPSAPTTTWEAASASAVATNQVGAQDGRLVFILMDRTIPVGQPTLAAKKIASAAVEALGPGDLAAVVTTSGGIPQTLTANRARLMAALNRGDWSTGLSREQEAVTEYFVTLDPLSDGRCLCGICVLETVTNLANAVRNTPRRSKSLLFIGTSLIVQSGPRAPSADVGCDVRLRDARATMFDALERSHLTVHSIDPAGLVSLAPTGGALGGREWQDGPVFRRQMLQAATHDHLDNQGSLRILPELTGGRVVVNTNAPETKVPEIFQESDAYYVIGYEPGRSLRDDPRSIKVNVARDGVQVTATRSVAAPMRSPSPSARGVVSPSPLESALSSLLPVARVPLDLAVAAFASPDGPNAFVSVSVNAASFAEGGSASLPLDFGVTVLDQKSRHVASAKQTSTVTPPRDGSTARMIELQSHVTLKPGDYELRAAVMDRGSSLAASVFAQLAIPPFADVPLSLSTIILGTRERTDASDAATPRIPIIPTTQRAFRNEERIWSFMQVYQGTERRDDLQAVAVRTIVVDERDRPVYDRSLTLSPMEFVQRRADVRIMLPLAKLSPGRYVFRIDATLGQRTASRGVPFIIE